MALSARVEEGVCCGAGNCALVCPEVFLLDAATNRVRLRRIEVPEDLIVAAKRAALDCPTQAIEILEGND
jgi:ferredoxin